MKSITPQILRQRPPSVTSPPSAVSPSASLYDRLRNRFGESLVIKDHRRIDFAVRYFLPKMKSYIDVLDLPSFQSESLHSWRHTHTLFNMPLTQLEKRVEIARDLDLPYITTRLLTEIDPEVRSHYTWDLVWNEMRCLYRLKKLTDLIKELFQFDSESSSLEFIYRTSYLSQIKYKSLACNFDLLKGQRHNLYTFIVNPLIWITSYDRADLVIKNSMKNFAEVSRQSSFNLPLTGNDFYEDMKNFYFTGVTKYMDQTTEDLLGLIFECDPQIFLQYTSRNNQPVSRLKSMTSASVIRHLGFTYRDVIQNTTCLRLKYDKLFTSDADAMKVMVDSWSLSDVIRYCTENPLKTVHRRLSVNFGLSKFLLKDFNIPMSHIRFLGRFCMENGTNRLDLYRNKDFANSLGFSNDDIGRVILLLGFPSEMLRSGWDEFAKANPELAKVLKCSSQSKGEIASLFYLFMKKKL